METSEMLVDPFLTPAEREAVFNSLSLAKRRKAGVQDALYQIDIKKVQVSHAGYMTLHGLGDDNWYSFPSFQQMLDSPGNNDCSACAAGTLWVGFVHIMDKASFEEVNFEDITKKLRGLFSVKQLRMIEMVFENSGRYHKGVLNNEEEDLCYAFYSNIFDIRQKWAESSEMVFRAICANILSSKTGQFNPAILPTNG